MTNLEALLERVRAAPREFDVQLEIDMAQLCEVRIKPYTRSIDAISKLVERKMSNWAWGMERYHPSAPTRHPYEAHVDGGTMRLYYGHAPTAPLALCIAFLEALIAQETENTK